MLPAHFPNSIYVADGWVGTGRRDPLHVAMKCAAVKHAPHAHTTSPYIHKYLVCINKNALTLRRPVYELVV